jgi:hypothetical protein
MFNFKIFDFLFDSNSVRDCARRFKSEHEWSMLWKAWKTGGYTSAWIPWTIGEVVGTNLMRKDPPITSEFCAETALAVQRFDRIASRLVLPDPSTFIKWSMRAFVGYDPMLPVGEIEHRASIKAAKRLRNPDQVKVTMGADNIHTVEIYDDQLGLWAGQRLPLTFATHTSDRIERWKERLQKAGRFRDDLTHEEILNAIGEHILPTVVGLGRDVGVPDYILRAYKDKTRSELVGTPFIYSAVAQDWDCIQRSLGRKPGRVQETLGRDLVIALYIPLAKWFVVSDVDYRKLLQKVYPVDNLITFEEFCERLLASC